MHLLILSILVLGSWASTEESISPSVNLASQVEKVQEDDEAIGQVPSGIGMADLASCYDWADLVPGASPEGWTQDLKRTGSQLLDLTERLAPLISGIDDETHQLFIFFKRMHSLLYLFTLNLSGLKSSFTGRQESLLKQAGLGQYIFQIDMWLKRHVYILASLHRHSLVLYYPYFLLEEAGAFQNVAASELKKYHDLKAQLIKIFGINVKYAILNSGEISASWDESLQYYIASDITDTVLPQHYQDTLSLLEKFLDQTSCYIDLYLDTHSSRILADWGAFQGCRHWPHDQIYEKLAILFSHQLPEVLHFRYHDRPAAE